jgi:DNA (cytosine-5)-methyltransferase 1
MSLFSGIGAPEKALENLGVDFNLAAFCEFDKYAVKSYCAIHGVDESKNLGDVTKVDTAKLPKDLDLIVYGFPCQDISNGGKMQGLFNEDGTLTRSGLFFEALRIIEDTKPKIAIAENVKALTSKRFATEFKIVLDSLESAGYNNYWKVLNAKDFGIPQNRERVFIVSIRKDVDRGLFQFPEGFPLEKRLKDILEDDVDEKYYLSEKTISTFNRHKEKNQARGNGFGWMPTEGDGVAFTLSTSGGTSGPRAGDNFIIVKEATKKGFAEAFEGDSINLEQPNSTTRRGRVGKGVAQTLTTSCNQAVVEPKTIVFDRSGYMKTTDVANTLTARNPTTSLGNHTPITAVADDCLRIRKLTPLECFRLMGFDDESFHRAEAVNSNSQLYRQAGNSIVVDVLEELFCMMLDESGNLYV